MVNEEQQEYRATGTEFKHEDTTQVMRIRFIAGNRFPIYPTEGHKFVAKIGKAYGSYIGDYPVSVSGNSFEVKSSDLKGLDNGGYRLEIWESYIDSEGKMQTGIFPSPRAFVSFTINQNIEDTAWNLVKDISFQDLVNTAVVAAGQNIVVAGTNTLPAGSQASVTQKYENSKNEFTFNIPEGIKGDPGKPFSIAKVFPSKDTMNGDGLSEGDFVIIASDVNDPNNATLFTWTGSEFKEIADLSGAQGPQGPKGETGTVDNAGLTTAPAFVKLQTQVNNSAVGTNLLTNTSDFISNWSGMTSVSTSTEYNGYPSMVFTSSTQLLAFYNLSLGKLQNSTQYAASFWAKADNAGDQAHTELWGSNGRTNFVLTTNWERYTAVVTSDLDANTNNQHSRCYFGVPDGNKGNVYIALPKLEKGSVATDWSPAPEDAMTAIQALQQRVSQLEQKINQ